MPKCETVEEFLQRGGEIKRLPPGPTPDDEQKVTPTGPAGGILTLADGSLFYSDSKPKKAKKKVPPVINFSALPASLLKYVHNLPRSN